MEIEFLKSLDIYRYFDVPPEEPAALMAAESQSEYLNLVFSYEATDTYNLQGQKVTLSERRNDARFVASARVRQVPHTNHR